MGQRLTIAIKENDKFQASASYHWSGNTKSAAELVSTILGASVLAEGSNFATSRVLYRLENTGATLGKNVLDRNMGIISIYENSIEEQITHADHLAIIDYDNMTVDFDMFYGRDIDDELDLYETESDITAISDIRETNFDHTAVPFDGWSDFVKFISENEFFVDQCDTGDDIPVVWQVIK